MLVRTEQLEKFRKYTRGQFETRMMVHLRAKFPDRLKTVTDDALRRRVAAGVDQAYQYGIEEEDDVELFLECLITLGDDFATAPRYPWARRILRRGDLTGSAKMDRVHEHLIFEVPERHL